MSNKDDPAFPTLTEHGINNGMPGMTLRDYFAAKAMQSYFNNVASSGLLVSRYYEEIAEESYTIADAMLKAREAQS